VPSAVGGALRSRRDHLALLMRLLVAQNLIGRSLPEGAGALRSVAVFAWVAALAQHTAKSLAIFSLNVWWLLLL